MKGFDYHSSAKRSPFSPTPFCNNVHKSGFFPPGESYSLTLNFYIISAYQKREIYVRKRSRELKKSQLTGFPNTSLLDTVQN